MIRAGVQAAALPNEIPFTVDNAGSRKPIKIHLQVRQRRDGSKPSYALARCDADAHSAAGQCDHGNRGATH